jgi:ApbE superfamily uncharacterized protein (UPF0280 family)
VIKYGERIYRDFSDTSRWKSFRVRVETTDLLIRACDDYSGPVAETVARLRDDIRKHIDIQPDFLTSFNPVARISGAPEVVELMYEASEKAGVGPMAAVAGAIARLVGTGPLSESNEAIVENGGDIWLRLITPACVSIFAGNSPFSGKAGLMIYPDKTPLGVCTSSGRVGPSFSYGIADAVTILSPCAALADAAATGAGNIVKSENDIHSALEYTAGIDGITGTVIIIGDRLAVRGDIEMVDPNP